MVPPTDIPVPPPVPSSDSGVSDVDLRGAIWILAQVVASQAQRPNVAPTSSNQPGDSTSSMYMAPKKKARTGQRANVTPGVTAVPVPISTEGATVPPTDIPVPPPAPASDSCVPDIDIRGAIQMLTQLVTSQAQRSSVGHTSSSHPRESASPRVNKFLQLDPPVFTGTDPEEDPQDFIDEMHKSLIVMHTTKIEGVELASYRLKGVAYSWFELWEESPRAAEFKSMKQGSMNVWEYHMEFARLSKNAIHMLPTIEARVCRFIQGHSPLVINEASIAALNSDMNYGKMVAFAQATETRKLKNKMQRQSSSKARSAGNFAGSSSGGGVIFLGHVVSSEGIKVDPQKISAKAIKFQWSDACVKSFQELKARLTTTSVLTLPEGINGFVLYCDASRIGLGCVLMQHGKLKEGIHKPKTMAFSLGMDDGSTKMYHDLKEVYWWNDMKRNVADFVARCPNCQQVKDEHQRPGRLTQNIEIPMWKWLMINMEFVRDASVLFDPGSSLFAPYLDVSGKANVVADALRRKAESMGNLAFILADEKPLALDI
ncbi:uncharacterized protein [Nicotiana tomentosiformis]|uniref:uncharacterized protein n=1 Tax=Nicotiana tomentosiformis TaxID=4098 RepID=UPI00388C7A9E